MFKKPFQLSLRHKAISMISDHTANHILLQQKDPDIPSINTKKCQSSVSVKRANKQPIAMKGMSFKSLDSVYSSCECRCCD